MRRLAGILISILLVLPGLFTLYLGVYHASASTTVPATTLGDAERDWHRTQSGRLLLLASIWFGVVVILRMARDWWRRRSGSAG